jgi:hypothetical protein
MGRASATAAFMTRAPSMCTGSPCSSAFSRSCRAGRQGGQAGRAARNYNYTVLTAGKLKLSAIIDE